MSYSVAYYPMDQNYSNLIYIYIYYISDTIVSVINTFGYRSARICTHA